MAEESEIQFAEAVRSAMFEVVMAGNSGADLTDEIMSAVEGVIATIPDAQQREEAGAAIRGRSPAVERRECTRNGSLEGGAIQAATFDSEGAGQMP